MARPENLCRSRRALPISARAGLAAKSASPSACRARASSARSRPGPASPCRRPSRWSCSAMASPRSAMRSARLAARAQSRRGRGRRQCGVTMMRALAPDRERATLAVGGRLIGFGGAVVGLARSALSSLGALAGLVLVARRAGRSSATCRTRSARTVAVAAIVVFFAISVGLPLSRRGAEPRACSCSMFLSLRLAGVRRRPCRAAAAASRRRAAGLGRQ